MGEVLDVIKTVMAGAAGFGAAWLTGRASIKVAKSAPYDSLASRVERQDDEIAELSHDRWELARLVRCHVPYEKWPAWMKGVEK